MTPIERVLQDHKVNKCKADVLETWLQRMKIPESKFRTRLIVQKAFRLVLILLWLSHAFFPVIAVVCLLADHYTMAISVVFYALFAMILGTIIALVIPPWTRVVRDFYSHVEELRGLCGCRGDHEIDMETARKKLHEKLIEHLVGKLRKQIIIFNARDHGISNAIEAGEDWQAYDENSRDVLKMMFFLGFINQETRWKTYYDEAKTKLSPDELSELGDVDDGGV